MIVPTKLKILGLDWQVKVDKNVSNEGNCYGSTHYTSQTFFLDPTNTPLHNEETFIHEVLHALFWQMGLGKDPMFKNKEGRDVEEKIVHILASGLHQVFRDNDMFKL